VSDDLTALLGRITAWLDDDSGGSNDQYEQSYALLSEAAAALASERQAREKAEQERDRLREALTDVLRHCPTLDTLNAVDDDAGSGKRPCPLPKTPRIADIRDWHAALSPQDGQPT
jgi:hypothetical protein